jgi:hypothetical protein
VPQHALRNARAPVLTARESRAASCSTGHRPSPPPTTNVPMHSPRSTRSSHSSTPARSVNTPIQRS